jgi:hypothetical protein
VEGTEHPRLGSLLTTLHIIIRDTTMTRKISMQATLTCSLILTLLSFAIYAMGWHFNDMPRIIIQIFAPAMLPITFKELYDNRDGDDY